MESYFECYIENTKKSVVDVYSYLHRKKLRMYGVLLAALGVLCMWRYLRTGSPVPLVLAIVCWAVFAAVYVLLPCFMAAKDYKRLLKQYDGKIPPARIWFGEEIHYQGGSMQMTIPYANLQKVEILQKHILLQHQGGPGLLFPADSLVEGSISQLLQFLEEKNPNLKKPK